MQFWTWKIHLFCFWINKHLLVSRLIFLILIFDNTFKNFVFFLIQLISIFLILIFNINSLKIV
jgi:hypothetical protein